MSERGESSGDLVSEFDGIAIHCEDVDKAVLDKSSLQEEVQREEANNIDDHCNYIAYNVAVK